MERFRQQSWHQSLLHVNEEILNEKNGGTIPEPSHRCCIVRKVISKKVTAGGRFDLFLDSART